MIEFRVDDMSCGHCVAAITKAVKQVDAQGKVDIDLAGKRVRIESARDAEGFGITVAYFDTPEHIAAWKANAEHRHAQALGHQVWYEHFELRVARVERAYGKPHGHG